MFGKSKTYFDEIDFPTWMKRADTKLMFCLWPRACYHTGRLLWFTRAYRTRRYWRSGDLDFISEDRWYGKNEFILLRLKTWM